MENRVQFNLTNVYYAKHTISVNQGVITHTYATPVRIYGAVSLSLSQSGGSTEFYADGVKFFTTFANQGYSGTLEMARIPDDFLKDILNYNLLATSKVLIEDATKEPESFALLFQIDGDQNDTLYTFYHCVASRPEIASSTNTESKEPQTQSIEVTISPIENGRVLAKTTAETTTTTRAGWFSSVFTAQS